ncbi:MAG: histidine kinase [Anaerolineae bacterium]|jgi:signal transduction histidine kinase|nr:histidine kinase [Anaerolineae bacterium]
MARSRLGADSTAWPILAGAALLVSLYLLTIPGYLLFHSVAEIFAIVISVAVFTLAWNSRRFSSQHYLLFVGMALLAASAFNVLHALSYEGMGVFPEHDADLPTQLWLARRYIESVALLIAPLFLRRRLNPTAALFWFAAVTAALLASIFLGWFPAAYVTGEGLTPFKVVSEYLIAGFFLLAAAWVHRERREFDRGTAAKLIWALVISAAAEILFTLYVGVYDLPNRLGHFLTIVAYYLIYRAIVESGVIKPYEMLTDANKSLSESEANLRASAARLEAEAVARQAANDELAASRRELQGLARRLVHAQEDQSRALSREIHDTSAQGMSALKLGLLRIKRKADSPEVVAQAAAELLRIADTVVEDLHRLSVNLRPSSLDRYGLASALEQLIESMRRQTGIEVAFHSEGMEERLPDDVETALYRITQEATTNIARYAKATRASVSLVREPAAVILAVEDNGVGFDVAEALSRGRLGLLGMRERAQMLGGTFTVMSQPGRGARVCVSAPLNGRAAVDRCGTEPDAEGRG